MCEAINETLQTVKKEEEKFFKKSSSRLMKSKKIQKSIVARRV